MTRKYFERADQRVGGHQRVQTSIVPGVRVRVLER